jgi:hypothetical protein
MARIWQAYISFDGTLRAKRRRVWSMAEGLQLLITLSNLYASDHFS